MMEHESDNSLDDDIPQLSAEAMEALREIYEQRSRDAVGAPPLDSEHPASDAIFEKDMNDTFPEDWQMSQFWYDDTTSDALANLVKRMSGSSGKIACLSCPSVFRSCGSSENIHLYEFDRRFARFGDSYFFYDYNLPEEVGVENVGSYSVVIADPPFLSEECLEKVSITVKKLIAPHGKIILCTGAVMEDHAEKYLGLKKTSFTPSHKKNLGNIFACFTNFPLDNVD